MNGIAKSAWVVVCILVFVWTSRADVSPSDVKEINQYKLTDKTLAQYFQATKNLIPVLQKNPKIKNESEDSEGTDSLNQLAQEFDAIPGAKKAVSDAGIATQEYLTFHFALIYAASGDTILKAGGQLPGEYSKENVEFYRTHEAELKKHEADFEVISKFSDEESEDEDEEH